MQAPGVWSPPPCRTHATTHTRSHAHTDGSPFGDRSGRGVQKRTAKQDLARTGSSQGVFIPSTLHDARTAQGFGAHNRLLPHPSTGGFKYMRWRRGSGRFQVAGATLLRPRYPSLRLTASTCHGATNLPTYRPPTAPQEHQPTRTA